MADIGMGKFDHFKIMPRMLSVVTFCRT